MLGGPCTGKCIICRASCASRNLRWGPPNGACRHELESVKLWLEVKGRICGSREVPTHGADNGGCPLRCWLWQAMALLEPADHRILLMF